MRYLFIILGVSGISVLYSTLTGYPLDIGVVSELYEIGQIIMTTPPELPAIPLEQMAGSVENEVEVIKEDTLTQVEQVKLEESKAPVYDDYEWTE